MSWLQPTPENKQDIQQLREERPELYAYAQVLALALRIDSRLLRNLRLRFLPKSSVELETELWFSPLIHTRNVQAATMYSGIARALCDALKNENLERFASAKTEIGKLTRHWPETDRIEQEMRWAVLEGDEQALKNNVQRILKTLTVAEGDVEKRELARWVKGTLPILNGTKQADTGQQWLSQYVVASLGLAGNWWAENAELQPLPAVLVSALPTVKKQKIGLRLRPGILEVLNPEKGLEMIEISVPLPTTVILRPSEDTKYSDIELYPFWIGEKIYIPRNINSLDLQMIDGSLFQIIHTTTEESLIYRCRKCQHIHTVLKSDLILDYEVVGSDPDRGMGTEYQYQTIEYVNCQACDNGMTFIFNVWEYPIGIKNHETIESEDADIIESFSQSINFYEEDDWHDSSQAIDPMNEERNLLRKFEDKLLNTSQKDINDILHLTKSFISEVIFADNLYIALYDEGKNEIHFPLILKDGSPLEISSRLLDEKKRGKTEEIILTGHPILHRTLKESYDFYQNPYMEEFIGNPLASWIGVPIKSLQRQVIGVIAAYHPDKENIYSESDLLFLEKVAEILSAKMSALFEEKRSNIKPNLLVFGKDFDLLNSVIGQIGKLYRSVTLDVTHNLEEMLDKIEVNVFDAIILIEERYLRYISKESKKPIILIQNNMRKKEIEYDEATRIFRVDLSKMDSIIPILLNAILRPMKIGFSYSATEYKIEGKDIFFQIESLLIQKLPFISFANDFNKQSSYSSLNEYIDILSKTGFLIVFISQKFLHSIYGMLELIELTKSENKEVFFIILKSAIDFIHDPNKQDLLIEHWKSQETKLKKDLEHSSLSQHDAFMLSKNQEIITSIPQIIKFIRYAHISITEEMIDGDFIDLIKAIHNNLKKNQDYEAIYNILDEPYFIS
ncbi:GAF domain-containing protein [Thiothrix eikelboomii]|uniref:GAF domain-containing protein n=1 Tax=Thiothrix eikelboomii TaxID=92487 RepID=A0A1T4WG65_9GAMM|nr:GAF domain-containing protein [Thiothrix eikelboomii]SKA75895.1 GAF domain-containing protein [Thiothrix eikelboomii]